MLYIKYMKKLALAVAVICVLAIATLTLAPAFRFGSFGDGEDRTADCQTALSNQNAPTRYNTSLIGYYLTTKPIKGTAQNWGTCPYSNYKAKTLAVELWILGVASGLFAFKQYRIQPSSNPSRH